MSWLVIQALVAAGHALPTPINTFALRHGAFNAPLSLVRWLLQHGMTFDHDMLQMAAQSGRVDIIQLAHSMRVPITPDIITAAAKTSHWEVLVWACRNGVPVEHTRILHLDQLNRVDFKFDEQHAELVSLLQDVHTIKSIMPATRSAAKQRKSKGRHQH